MPIKIPGKSAEEKKPVDGKMNVEKEQETNAAAAGQQLADEETKAAADTGQKKASEQLEAKQGEATVTKQNKKTKTEHSTTEKVGDPVIAPVGQLATVTVEMSMTKNLGNYNSAKLGVHLSMPSLPDEIETTYEGAKLWVENKVNELLEELQPED